MGVRASSAVTLGDADSVLTERALEFLGSGPADSSALISYVCQLPGAPRGVAEHMAAALFAGQRRFTRAADGRWQLRDVQAELADVAKPLEATRDVLGESFVVVDVETTGINAQHGDRVTEVAVVLVRDRVATPVFDTLINPERTIPPAIVAITNITWEMVAHAPRFADVCDQLLGVLEGNVFVAHNAAFDWNFLSMEVQRVTHRRLDGRRLCTVRLSKKLVPQLRRRHLDAVAHHFGVNIEGRHRAGGDALATAHILLRLLDAARDRGCTSIDDLERLVATRSTRARPHRPSALPGAVVDDTTA